MYKHKDRLVIYLPKSLIYDLQINEGDEVSFAKIGGSYTITKAGEAGSVLDRGDAPTEAEILILKKLERIKYGERTKEEIIKLLNPSERVLLNGIIKKMYVKPFIKDGKRLYSITNWVYERYLVRNPEAFKKGVLRRKDGGTAVAEQRGRSEGVAAVRENRERDVAVDAGNLDFIERLKRDGFVVISGSADAENVSARLEDDIRRGLVLGTRAFNRKYYIVYRNFVNKSYPKIIDALRGGEMTTDEVSLKTGIDPDGVRAVMFVLAERGEVMERRRDLFVSVD